MLTDLTPAQLALADYISELSELAYHAIWMENIEFKLWRAMQEGPCVVAHLDVTELEMQRLKELSVACGGWIRFDDLNEETYVPMDEWLTLVEKHAQRPRL